MGLAFVFSLGLLAAVLLSESARVRMLSVATLFLALGFALGEGGLQLGGTELAEQPLLTGLAEVALFTLLFTDGARLELRHLRRHWRLPARALAVGFPLTLALAALLARTLVGLSWIQSLLVAAALCPTEPVFAEELVLREGVPEPLRRLLTIESGLNDGLAVPLVLIFLAMLGSGDFTAAQLLLQGLGSALLGVTVPLLVGLLHRGTGFEISDRHEPLYGFALGMLLLTGCLLLGWPPYVAAFVGGVTMRAITPDRREDFHDFGVLLGEVLKLASVFIFGLLLSRDFVDHASLWSLLFGVLVLVVVRPLAFWLCLLGSGLDWRQRLAAAWFGPRGFASLLFALWIFRSGVREAGQLCALVAVVVALSMLAHTATDRLAGRWLASP